MLAKAFCDVVVWLLSYTISSQQAGVAFSSLYHHLLSILLSMSLLAASLSYRTELAKDLTLTLEMGSELGSECYSRHDTRADFLGQRAELCILSMTPALVISLCLLIHTICTTCLRGIVIYRNPLAT